MFIPGPDMPLSHEEAAEIWARAIVGDDLPRHAKDWKAALLAMPLAYPGTGQYHTHSSAKQYAILDLEREGLAELVVAVQKVVATTTYGYCGPSAGVSQPTPEWRRTALGDKVVALLKEMEAAK